MVRQSWSALFATLGALAVVAACGEPAQVTTSTPNGPSLSASGGAITCSASSMNSTTAKTFSDAAQQKLVKGLEDALTTAYSANNTLAARNAGYDIFREIAAAVLRGTVKDVPSASTLTNQVTACMLFSTAELPADFPHDYTNELTSNTPGAFAVRGGAGDSAGVVLARGASPISGLGPQPGYTWSDVTSGIPGPSRVLFYGQPSVLPNAYDWKAIPANATFSPPLIVGLCDPGQTYMVYESSGNILQYQDAYFLAGPCPVASASQNVWQRSLALGQHLLSGLLPPTLHASALNPGGLGGLASGFSTFTTFNVGTVTISYGVQPHDATVLPSDVCPAGEIGDPYNIGPITFTVTKDGIAVGGTSIALTQINNNGTPTTVCGATTGMTNANGTLTLNHIGLTKTGGYQLVATGNVPNRNINSTGGTSDRFNIRP